MDDPTAAESDAARERSRVQVKLHEIAVETGYFKETIEWVWALIAPADRAPETPRDAAALCERLIRDLNDLYPGALDATLEELRLRRSEDIGQIVFALVEKDLIIAESGDSQCDFNGLFTLEKLDAFLAEKGIRRRTFAPGALRRFCHSLYWGGIILVVGGWAQVVPYPLSWIGWTVGMIGFAGLHWQARKQPPF